jgi:thiamine-phosphate pyrophosphorylase
MPARCLLYYITDRTALGPDEPTRCRRLLEKISESARAGVDYIQLREKDLSVRDLESIAREAVRVIQEAGTPATLLINSRTDVALAAGAAGVHLRSDDVSPQEVKAIWIQGHVGTAAPGCPAARSAAAPVIGVSCHSPAEVAQAAANSASFAVFAPVFEKKDAKPAGLAQLREACQARIPVLALGGITLSNAPSCFEAGAAGVAAIRLFQEKDVADVVSSLRRQWGVA